MDYGRHVGHLLLGEEGIATRKVHDLVAQVAYAAARTDTAIGYGIAVDLGKLLEHDIIEGEGEGSTCTREFLCLTGTILICGTAT